MGNKCFVDLGPGARGADEPGHIATPISEIEIPDAWHLAMRLAGEDRAMVLRLWHLAHDLHKKLAGEE